MKCIYKDSDRLVFETNLKFLGCVFGVLFFVLTPFIVLTVVGLLAIPLFIGLGLVSIFYIAKIRYQYTFDKTKNKLLIESFKPYAGSKVLTEEQINMIRAVGLSSKYDEDMPNSSGHNAAEEIELRTLGPKTKNYKFANREHYAIRLHLINDRFVSLNQVTTSNSAEVEQAAKQLAEFLGVPFV